jgi:hypothetical protein
MVLANLVLESSAQPSFPLKVVTKEPGIFEDAFSELKAVFMFKNAHEG